MRHTVNSHLIGKLLGAFFICIISTTNAQYIYTAVGGGRPIENIDALQVCAHPGDVASDANGNVFFIDQVNHAVRKFDISTAKVRTVAGGNGRGFSGDNGFAIAAKLDRPRSITLDNQNGILFIADFDNRRIRKVDLTTGLITTIAGTGAAGATGDGNPAISAPMTPNAIHVNGSTLYLADASASVIRKINLQTGIVERFAGTGEQGNSGDGSFATQAKIKFPSAIATDTNGAVYFTDGGNHNLRRVGVDGQISTVAGTTSGYSGDGGPATNAAFDNPTGLEIDQLGNIFVLDGENFRVRKITIDGIISTIAGKGNSGTYVEGGLAKNVRIEPLGIAVENGGNLLIATNYTIHSVDASTNTIQTLIGNGSPSFEGDGYNAVLAQLHQPSSIYKTTTGFYIADAGNNRIRKVNPSTSLISTIAGNGAFAFSEDGVPAVQASLYSADVLTVDLEGNVYFVERYSNRIRKIDAATQNISTVAGTGVLGYSGDGGPAGAAKLNSPRGLCLDPNGNIFFSDGNRIRKIDLNTNIISSVAGGDIAGFSGDDGLAINAKLNNPRRLTSDSQGNIYFSDESNQRIRKIISSTGIITTVAGNGSAGFSGDGGPATAAQLNYPAGISVDENGNLFIADRVNGRIRKVSSSNGVIITCG
jgi:trimeric autotransporter adhesin